MLYPFVSFVSCIIMLWIARWFWINARYELPYWIPGSLLISWTAVYFTTSFVNDIFPMMLGIATGASVSAAITIAVYLLLLEAGDNHSG